MTDLEILKMNSQKIFDVIRDFSKNFSEQVAAIKAKPDGFDRCEIAGNFGFTVDKLTD